MTDYIEDKSQEGRILALLREKGNAGAFIYEFMTPRPIGLGIAQYNARIFGLRKKGYVIENTKPGHFVLREEVKPVQEGLGMNYHENNFRFDTH